MSIREKLQVLLGYRIKSRVRILIMLILLFPLCLAFGSISHNMISDKSVLYLINPFGSADIIDKVFGLLFLYIVMMISSPLTIPLSLGELFGLAQNSLMPPGSPIEAVYMFSPWILVSIFWISMISLLILLFRTRLLLLYFIYATVFLFASVYWASVSSRIMFI